MTFQSNSLLARRSRFSRVFTLGLTAAFVAQASAFSPHPTRPCSLPGGASGAGSYLALVGAVPLRFAPLPPEPVDRPVPSELLRVPVSTIPVAELSPTEPNSASMTDLSMAAKSPEAPTKLLSILPDDTPRRDVRPEDVMPYFQLPLQNERPNASGVNLPFTPAQSASPTLPTSSATYQLK